MSPSDPSFEDSIAWPPEALRQVHPRRGQGPDVELPPIDAAASFRDVVKAYKKASRKGSADRWVDAYRGTGAHNPDCIEAAQERLKSADSSPDSLAVESLLLQLVAWSCGEGAESNLIDHWIGAQGLTFAVDAALSAAAEDAYAQGFPKGLRRLRERLAIAEGEAYEAALRIASQRRDEKMRLPGCVAASYLFPTQAEWVEEDLIACRQSPGLLKYDSVYQRFHGPVILHQLVRQLAFSFHEGRQLSEIMELGEALPTLIYHLGQEALGPVVDHLTKFWTQMDEFREAVALIPLVPSDQMITALASRVATSEAPKKEVWLSALRSAVRRHPRRALRVLGPRVVARGEKGTLAKDLVRAALTRAPEVADEIDKLAEEPQKALRKLQETIVAVEEASPEDMPRVLREPPWHSKTKPKKSKIQVIEGLEPLPTTDRMSWRPGLRAIWQAKDLYPYPKAQYVLRADSEKIGPYFAGFTRRDHSQFAEALPWFVVKHELAVVPILLGLRESSLAQVARFMEPFDVAALAPLAAEAHARLKAVGREARRWLLRYPETAAIGLVPEAVGPKGKERQNATAALQTLVTNGHRQVVEKVAERYGATEALAEVFDFDPLSVFPKKMPKMPRFWEPSVLPRPELKNGGALTLDAMSPLGEMLAFTSPDDPYPGIGQVQEACEPASLARFAWGLFEAWLADGGDSKQKWAFYALGLLGNDETARRLEPLLRKWPSQGGYSRAVQGLDVLAVNGSDFALMQVNGIALKSKTKGIQKAAREAIARMADERCLSTDELADRLVPDLGLGEENALVLDYGRRTFNVIFDETLTPWVVREDGKKVKTLPKPGKTDDAEKAPAAYERYKELKKQLRTVAKQQLARMELAMCGSRRWSPDDFSRLVMNHPLLVHLVRRLVWGVWDNETLLATFRVDEEGALVNVDDEPYELPETTSENIRVGIAHRLELDDESVGRWAEILADYEIVPPFAQLARRTAVATDEDRAAKLLQRFAGRKVGSGSLRGLSSAGWRTGEVGDGGMIWYMAKSIDGEFEVRLGLEPGILVSTYDDDEQTLRDLWIVRSGGHKPAKAFGELTAVQLSEILGDVEGLPEVSS